MFNIWLLKINFLLSLFLCLCQIELVHAKGSALTFDSAPSSTYGTVSQPKRIIIDKVFHWVSRGKIDKDVDKGIDKARQFFVNTAFPDGACPSKGDFIVEVVRQGKIDLIDEMTDRDFFDILPIQNSASVSERLFDAPSPSGAAKADAVKSSDASQSRNKKNAAQTQEEHKKENFKQLADKEIVLVEWGEKFDKVIRDSGDFTDWLHDCPAKDSAEAQWLVHEGFIRTVMSGNKKIIATLECLLKNPIAVPEPFRVTPDLLYVLLNTAIDNRNKSMINELLNLMSI